MTGHMLASPSAAVQVPSNRKARRAARRRAGKKAVARAVAFTPAGSTLACDPAVESAVALISSGRHSDAERELRAVIAETPDCAHALFWLGCLAAKYRHFDKAYELFKRAVTINPGESIFWSEFGHCLSKMDQNEAATIAYRQAIQRSPHQSALQVDLGWAYFHLGKSTEAIQAFDRALEIDPGDARAHFAKGSQYSALGERDAAREAYTRAIECDPEYASAHQALGNFLDDSLEIDAHIARIERIIAKTPRKSRERAKLHFAVAKGHQRRKRHDEAFASYTAANRLMREMHAYDPARVRECVDDLIEAFQPDLFERLKSAGSPSELPVFIVGMPRSGSTLAQQILSSHPDVIDAGEFWKFPNMVSLISGGEGEALRYPQDIAKFLPEDLARLGQDYVETLSRDRPPSALRITDKMLNNAFNVGLISILFPNAAIIHCRRDPLDTCLSCYFQSFAEADNLAYTFDLEDLGQYYREYERMMAHWRQVLPSRMFELVYEDMVADQEGISRRLIDHLGLPWDDACLDFHAREGNVRTASLSQVRKPVYDSSMGAWRAYEKHLEPLKRALGVCDHRAASVY